MQALKRDVVIIGGGPIGTSLALGLARIGLQVSLVDAADPARLVRDGRNFAIVAGSWRLLERLGVTEDLKSTAQPLWGLEAVDGGQHIIPPPSILFSADDLDSPEPDEPLGQMVRAEALRKALYKATERFESLELIAPASFHSLSYQDHAICIELADGRNLKAGLLVGADGVQSGVRKALNIGVEGRDYGQSVFTANVQLSAPHQGIARQLFTPEGPFATLPLPDDCANLACYMKRGAAETLAALPVEQAEAELNARYGGFAGHMKIISETGAYPLKLQIATDMIARRAVLVGDAVRRVTPLAGQGLNQGFRDVAALIETVDEAIRLGDAVGSHQMCLAYRQARRFEGHAAALFLDGLDRLFSTDRLVPKALRSLGLGLASKWPGLRKAMAQRASASETGVPEWMDIP